LSREEPAERCSSFSIFSLPRAALNDMRPIEMKRSSQLSLVLHGWGGARPGAGRKRARGSRASVPHRTRPLLKSRHPVHITWRLEGELPNLRRRSVSAIIRRAFALAKERFGLRVVHFSIQRDHIHLICESKDARSLGEGLRALGIRIAKRLNHRWARRGRVFSERYHRETLETPRQVRNAVAYVLCNFHRHRENVGDVPLDLVDVCSSAPWFNGWKEPCPRYSDLPPSPVAEAHTWLLREGWKKHGLIGSWEVPGPRAKRASQRERLR
jgi:REP element-mobilizing transposase RayT